jgi:uncharacterized protein (TIGR00251 family)
MAIMLTIKAVPSSGKQSLTYDKNTNIFKCYLKSQPEKGKANLELIRFFSKLLNVTQEDITILKGGSGRNKLIKINKNGLSIDNIISLCILKI